MEVWSTLHIQYSVSNNLSLQTIFSYFIVKNNSKQHLILKYQKHVHIVRTILRQQDVKELNRAHRQGSLLIGR